VLKRVQTGVAVAEVCRKARQQVGAERDTEKITVDNGTEFSSKSMDAWCHRRNVRLDFIRPGRPKENGYIESFNGEAARRVRLLSESDWSEGPGRSPRHHPLDWLERITWGARY
jgi:transposase InsO family protein